MPVVNGNKPANHFPAPPPVGTQPAAVAPGTAVGVANWPHNAAVAAGVAGTLTINGRAIVLDLTIMELENVVSAINGASIGVRATIGRNGQLVLTSDGVVAVGGTPALLVALGLA